MELIPKLRDMLGAFLFRGDDVYKSLDVLSGGEKSRIALLQLLLSPVNLLVLDEPTNHLDIHSKDVLLSALRGFGGTVIFVSHDRGFIEQLATKVLHLEPGYSAYYPGGYDYYLEQLEKKEGGADKSAGLPLGSKQSFSPTPSPKGDTESTGSTVSSSSGKSEQTNPASPLKSPGASSLSWEEQKKLEAERRKKEKTLARFEQEIEELEAKKAALEQKLSDPAVYSNGEKAKAVQREISETAAKIDEVTEQWMLASE